MHSPHRGQDRAIAMKYFFDTEFIEDGRTIDLISIGITAEDGRTYYAESEECNYSRASPWVQQNVLPKLIGKHGRASRYSIGRSIIDFVGKDPEFWAYFADYDWVVLCQLYGTMMDLPETWPKYCLDLKQMVHMLGNPSLQRPEGGDHNALADAIWVRDTYNHLTRIKGQ